MPKEMVSIPKGEIYSPHFGNIVFKSSEHYSTIMEIHDDESGDPLECHYWQGEEYDGNCVRMPKEHECQKATETT